MMLVVKFALEPVQHVVDLGKAGVFKRAPCVERAIAAPADDDYRAVYAGRLFDMGDEMRVDVPIGAVIPSDMNGSDRMADEKIFHLAAAIDEYRVRILLEKFVGLFGFKVFHGCTNACRRLHYRRHAGNDVSP